MQRIRSQEQQITVVLDTSPKELRTLRDILSLQSQALVD